MKNQNKKDPDEQKAETSHNYGCKVVKFTKAVLVY